MPRCLFVSQRIGMGFSGATVVSDRNLHHCRELFGPGGLEIYKVQKGRVASPVRKFLQAFGFVDGLLPRDVKAIVRKAEAGGFDVVFLDTSYFGLVAAALARRKQGARILVFYHDVLVQWWRSASDVSWWRKMFWARIYRRVESLSTQAAHVRVFLTERDRELLRTEYGAVGGFLVPVSVPDRFDMARCRAAYPPKPAPGRVLLFVGADYRPNVEGISWFVEQVAPRIESRLRVVGKGMEKYRPRWQADRVEVLGTVDDLDGEYVRADAVVIPLFSGSGMKVKTAEALMHGKRIFGTPEAFKGFALDFPAIGAICPTDTDFVAAIRAWEQAGPDQFGVNPSSRAAYEKDYSYSATLKAMGLALSTK